MTTLNLVEVVGEPRPYELKNGPAAGTKLVGWRVKDDKGTTYDISTKPGNEVKLGPDEFTITPSQGDYPPKLKRVSQGGGGRGRSPEETKRIEQQSARRDAIAYAAIVASVENRVPSLDEVETWSRHFFDGVGLGGGSAGVGQSSVPPAPPPAAESSVADGPRKAATSKNFNKAGILDPDTKKRVVDAIAGVPPTVEGLDAIDAALANQDWQTLFTEQGLERPPELPDTQDLAPVVHDEGTIL